MFEQQQKTAPPWIGVDLRWYNDHNRVILVISQN